MLTTTYALLSLSVEQKRAHYLLSKIQQSIQSKPSHQQRHDPEMLASVVDQVIKLDRSCRQRKVDVYLIPAVRKATKEADRLLAELEFLCAAGRRVFDSVRKWKRPAIDQGMTEISQLYSAVELYCNTLIHRLAKEEAELMPIARRVLSNEAWFAMGAQFLSLDRESEESLPPPQETRSLGPLDVRPMQRFSAYPRASSQQR